MNIIFFTKKKRIWHSIKIKIYNHVFQASGYSSVPALQNKQDDAVKVKPGKAPTRKQVAKVSKSATASQEDGRPSTMNGGMRRSKTFPLPAARLEYHSPRSPDQRKALAFEIEVHEAEEKKSVALNIEAHDTSRSTTSPAEATTPEPTEKRKKRKFEYCVSESFRPFKMKRHTLKMQESTIPQWRNDGRVRRKPPARANDTHNQNQGNDSASHNAVARNANPSFQEGMEAPKNYPDDEDAAYYDYYDDNTEYNDADSGSGYTSYEQYPCVIRSNILVVQWLLHHVPDYNAYIYDDIDKNMAILSEAMDTTHVGILIAALEIMVTMDMHLIHEFEVLEVTDLAGTVFL